jgi:uncharacterized protein YndB with AHSA1/START domain
MTAISPLTLRVETSVAWTPAEAFRRFTDDFGRWWPYQTHSVGGDHVARVVFETTDGGQIYEEHLDGTRFLWGTVSAVFPPTRVSFTWHPSRNAATAQLVHVEFAENPHGGTTVTLTSTEWERLGSKAASACRAYRIGWAYVLGVWSGRRRPWMTLLDVVVLPIDALVTTLRGGRAASIAKAGGRLPGTASSPHHR